MIVVFWVSFFLIAFSLFGYGLVWIGLARLMPPRYMPPPGPKTATVLIAARNESQDIASKIASLLSQDFGPHDISILIVSDGSDDNTVEEARRAAHGDPRVSVITMPEHGGKAAALNQGLDTIASDQIVIFSDANSILDENALQSLLAPFADAQVGGSVGQLSIRQNGGLMDRAERLFWSYDNALKSAEDRVAGVVSAQGTLYAVRRHLVGTVPADMADDLATSLAVVDQGYRLAFAKGASACEAVTSNVGGEFGRRVRSTERGWRGLMHYARLMNPVRTGLYAIQLLCHKGLRRLVAFLLPLLFLANLTLVADGIFYSLFFFGQISVYGLAILALLTLWGRRIPGASAAVMFLLGHAAIFWAITRYFFGVKSTKWSPVRG
jgi:cellulose synthase/poly-beta-1,6-N-acetylglucosamine synthase-like glycosyltransferase